MTHKTDWWYYELWATVLVSSWLPLPYLRQNRHAADFMMGSVGLMPWGYCLHLNPHTSSWYAHNLVLLSQLPYWDLVLINSTKTSQRGTEERSYFGFDVCPCLEPVEEISVFWRWLCSLLQFKHVERCQGSARVCVGRWLVGCVDETNMHRGTELAFFFLSFFFFPSFSFSLFLCKPPWRCVTPANTLMQTHLTRLLYRPEDSVNTPVTQSAFWWHLDGNTNISSSIMSH